MKKVAFYIESMILGGAEKLLADIVNHMDTTLFDITVISIFRESVYPSAMTYDLSALVKKGIHVKTLVDNRNKLKFNLFNHAYAHTDRGGLYRKLIKDTYDIEVAFYEGMPTEFVSYSVNAKSKKIAWLHTDNNRLYRDKSDNYLDSVRKVYSRFDCVVGVSEHVTQSFTKYIDTVPCITIRNGIDILKIREKAKEECDVQKSDLMTFVTVGRLVPVKGYDRLIHSAQRLISDGYRFRVLMIGDGGEKQKLQSMIASSNLGETVNILGAQENPFKYFKVSDVFVCTSHSEGFGLAMIEAMACGLPVMTADFEVAREIIGDDNSDLICKNDEDSIYMMMKNILDNPAIISKHKETARRRGESFDISEQVRCIQQLFLEDSRV